MVSNPESDPGFTFVDRRRRGDDAPPNRETPLPEPAPAPARPAALTAEPPGPAAGQPRADLASLCVMLYSDALANLGQVPDPDTGQPHIDLEQARFLVDLLAMLRDKTAGNRTPEESSLIEEVLAALQMGFVRAARPGPPATPRPSGR